MATRPSVVMRAGRCEDRPALGWGGLGVTSEPCGSEPRVREAGEWFEGVAEEPLRLDYARAVSGALGAGAVAVVALEGPERQEADALLVGPLQQRRGIRRGEGLRRAEVIDARH